MLLTSLHFSGIVAIYRGAAKVVLKPSKLPPKETKRPPPVTRLCYVSLSHARLLSASIPVLFGLFTVLSGGTL